VPRTAFSEVRTAPTQHLRAYRALNRLPSGATKGVLSLGASLFKERDSPPGGYICRYYLCGLARSLDVATSIGQPYDFGIPVRTGLVIS
jgi:hypothetical protein